MQPFESMLAWQRAHALVLAVYRVSAGWPEAERFGLVSQARRAAVSAVANMVEGRSRRGAREFRRFLDMSAGSLAELAYLLMLARDPGLSVATRPAGA